jgi:cell division transport system permease protein
VSAPEQKLGAAGRGLLPEGRLTGPMPWVLGIMMFLTLLAAAAGLGLGNAARDLDGQVGNRLVVQIVEANPDVRERQARQAVAALGRLAGVETVRRVPPAEMERLMEPLLGEGALETDVPVPAMIDVDVSPLASPDAIRTALARVAPAARVDDSSEWLGPVADLIGTLRWLAAGLVALMIGATAGHRSCWPAAGFARHASRHDRGAPPDGARRTRRSPACFSAASRSTPAFGGAVGLVAAGPCAAADRGAGRRAGASALVGSAGLPVTSWLVLIALPIGGVCWRCWWRAPPIPRALGRML